MRGSVADGIRWRHNLYCKILAFCQEGRFSFARFLALVPDRLRLAVGESVAKLQIPVLIPTRFAEQCAQFLPPSASSQRSRLGGIVAPQARRAIRFAQIDWNLDPFATAAWLEQSGEAILEAVGKLYLKGLSEVGQGEGGEETAYLVHLLLLRSFEKALTAGAGKAGERHALIATFLDLALQGLLKTEALPTDVLSARLGFQLAATNSAFTLGARREDILASRVNAYRTSAEAVELTRAQIQGPLELIRPSECVATVAARLLSQPLTETRLAQELLCDLVRDCLLLLVFQTEAGEGSPFLALCRQLVGSSAALSQYLFDPNLRAKLILLIESHRDSMERPLQTLRKLVLQRERAFLSGTTSVHGHGDLQERANLSATGALVFVLDEKVAGHAREVLARVRQLPEAEGERAYDEGRCYRISSDDRPLWKLSISRQEAHLFVDLKDFTKRTAAIKEQAMGDFLKRYFYQPIFELAARLKGGSPHRLSISNILGDAVAFRGEIDAIVSLALGVRQILEDAESELTKSVSDVLGGVDSAVAEIETAIANAQRSLEELDQVNPIAASADPDQVAGQRKRLAAQLQMLRESRDQRLARTVGSGLEAGAYIAFGAAAEEVDLDHPVLGPWSVAIGERLNEAARGTARSESVKAAREVALEQTRQDRQSPHLLLPFQVRLGRRYLLELPNPLAESLESAVYQRDKNSATHSVRELARWLLQNAADGIDRQEAALPPSVSRSEELYNGGCALSGPALDAFERASAARLEFQRLEVYRSQLSDQFHRTYWMEYDPERFVIARERVGAAEVAHLLRYTGKAIFRGLEKQGGVDVWELLLPDSPFGRGLLAELGLPHRKARSPREAAR